jgi:hypothetical protein
MDIHANVHMGIHASDYGHSCQCPYGYSCQWLYGHSCQYKYSFTPTKCTIYVRIIKYSIKHLKPLHVFQLIDKPSSGGVITACL